MSKVINARQPVLPEDQSLEDPMDSATMRTSDLIRLITPVIFNERTNATLLFP